LSFPSYRKGLFSSVHLKMDMSSPSSFPSLSFFPLSFPPAIDVRRAFFPLSLFPFFPARGRKVLLFFFSYLFSSPIKKESKRGFTLSSFFFPWCATNWDFLFSFFFFFSFPRFRRERERPFSLTERRKTDGPLPFLPSRRVVTPSPFFFFSPHAGEIGKRTPFLLSSLLFLLFSSGKEMVSTFPFPPLRVADRKE